MFLGHFHRWEYHAKGETYKRFSSLLLFLVSDVAFLIIDKCKQPLAMVLSF